MIIFCINYNDSSDEEDFINKINNYDVNKVWEKYYKNLAIDHKKLFKDSFYMHALGIKLLNNNKVNNIYYTKDKLQLKMTVEFNSKLLNIRFFTIY